MLHCNLGAHPPRRTDSLAIEPADHLVGKVVKYLNIIQKLFVILPFEAAQKKSESGNPSIGHRVQPSRGKSILLVLGHRCSRGGRNEDRFGDDVHLVIMAVDFEKGGHQASSGFNQLVKGFGCIDRKEPLPILSFRFEFPVRLFMFISTLLT
jgi:hypothetical protein